MGRKSKQKGSGFERQVAKLFEAALGMKFVRTPISGGWGRYQTKGDLVVEPGKTFGYFIECKKSESWDLWSTLFDGCGPLLNEWWVKAKQQAKEEGKIPVVVTAQNNRIPLALCPLRSVDVMSEHWYRMVDKDGDVIVLTSLDVFLVALKKKLSRK